MSNRLCFCDTPTSFAVAADIARVPSNVRRHRRQLFTVWRCEGCGSLHSLEEVDLDSYYRDYPMQQHRLDLWARLALGNRLRFLRKNGLGKDDTILDFGCGAGLFVTYLRQHGYPNAVGYDRFNQKYADASLLDRKYDAVLAQDVLEHAEDPEAMLAELRGLVRDGGLLCIGTPNAARLRLREHERFALELHQPYHRHILSKAALEALALRAGFEPLSCFERSWFDTPLPAVNWRFLRRYVRGGDNTLDMAVGEPQPRVVLKNPSLILIALLGYFFPDRTDMTLAWRRRAAAAQACAEEARPAA